MAGCQLHVINNNTTVSADSAIRQYSLLVVLIKLTSLQANALKINNYRYFSFGFLYISPVITYGRGKGIEVLSTSTSTSCSINY